MRLSHNDHSECVHSAQPWRRILRTVLAGTSASVLLCGLAACGDNTPSPSLTQSSAQVQGSYTEKLSGEFAAAGASSQKSAVDALIVGYSALQPNIAMSYDPSGSGAGVNTFLTGAVAWAGSDASLSDEQIQSSQAVCLGSTAFEIPVYVSPIAVVYNLSDYGLNESSVHMSPSTIAKIFTGKITSWDDPQLKKENPDIADKLPSLEITPVWRSDKSGTTKTFQTYLHHTAPNDWTSEPSETWPNSLGQGAKGTPAVTMTIGQAQGTLGYADFAQVSGLGTVAVGVGSDYVAPSPEATAKLIDESAASSDSLGTDGRFVIDVNYATQESGVYPIALVSYDIACPVYKDARTATYTKQWLSYALSDAGQKISQDNAGSAPIPQSLREKMLPVIDTITAAKN
ncbi:phosphate ABC transporter substrate-binding protein PstS [Alloscardovia macacae]|uniref:Phosphate-binding protein n=1 Tax=Alloscardovia macacae TaxID=1160091 RepID=A0A1Y2SXY2_9BIFI|nr:phosphate ABC transporter substrate-binding protein PstS [Alloscardovia macacae]OTA28905.1 phosphate ABC transporter substrate-binding protein PstS [Alloscardovia macacae]